jgi:hypothetical protein
LPFALGFRQLPLRLALETGAAHLNRLGIFNRD